MTQKNQSILPGMTQEQPRQYGYATYGEAANKESAVTENAEDRRIMEYLEAGNPDILPIKYTQPS